jgi:uncharacterized protein YoxC
MMIRAAAVLFLVLSAVLPSQGQTNQSDSQTLQAILVEIRAIHQEIKVTQTAQILLTELGIQQTAVNRAAQRADEAQFAVNDLKSAERSNAADLAAAKEKRDQADTPQESGAWAGRIEELTRHGTALTAMESERSSSLEAAQRQLRDAQDALDDIQNQLNAIVKQQAPRTP